MTASSEKNTRPSTPAGAVFHRCALQVNPLAYAKKFRGQKAGDNGRAHAEAIVSKAAELNVSVLAITDHNDVGGVSHFQEAAAGRGITVFPGFELTSSEGIHVLCIYESNTDKSRLERFLGEFGIHEPGSSSSLSNQPFQDILGTVRRQGGITIAAHVTSDNGLLRVLQGQARIRAWQSEDLTAIQIPALVDGLHPSYQSIITNENPDYGRPHPAGERLAVAAVNAHDVAKPEDLDQPSTTCFIKMSTVGIEGLRQAFLDPDSRVRLSPEGGAPVSDDHAVLQDLSWDSGFLDGVRLPLNPNLNVLVGGRGAGKSTVVESLRYVLGLDPLGDEARKAHQGIVQHVLRGGTKISLSVRSAHPFSGEYRIERTVPNPPVVRTVTNEISNLSPEDILPRIEVYGQHEIAELTRSRQKLTRLLSRFVKTDSSLVARKAEIRRNLKKTRRSILETQAELEELEERLATLPGLQETLSRYEASGLEELLGDRSLLVREERILNAISERVEPFRERLQDLRQELPIHREFLSAKSLEELPSKDILSDGDNILKRLSDTLEQLASGFEKALKRADREIAAIRFRWEPHRRDVNASYEKTLRELKESAVDGAEFIRLRTEIENLRPLRQREALLRQLEKELVERRHALLVEWEEIKAAEFRLLAAAAGNVGQRLDGRVQVEVTAAGNRRPLVDLLRERVGGRLASAITILQEVPDLSLPDFVQQCRGGEEALREEYPMTPAPAGLLAAASEDTLMRIEELELPPITILRLNTAASGESPVWRTLEELSTGQKATAVLLLLLLDSDAPLIVDQPEDDLDNRFITEGIVPRMREEKRRRQFIFSTHNANIPVLGDAELILGLTPAGEAVRGSARVEPQHMGSIDDRAVQELVEELLEGGRDAFETRRRKYGF
ncbi:MAG: AAA family ATPase [Gemmatimonadales bacterium]|nr:AAA family ATPase [Candidatus Palauibacter irciniicola]MYC18297.1 AAA family ATPase [Gemmatimonadales bacterium]